MKIKFQAIFLSFTLLTLLAACAKPVRTECDNNFCTKEYKRVHVIFKDNTGKRIVVDDYNSVIARTNRSTTQDVLVDTVLNKGVYLVASDADKNYLLETGDRIIITAKNPKTGQKKTADFTISGGTCACHIAKMSGPAEIVFN